MATIKQRLHRKNASNTYDTIHLETSADLLVGAVPITKGGTGATTAAAARAALQALYDDCPSRTSYTNVDFNTITTNGVYRMLYNDGTDQTPYHTPYAQYTSGYKTVTHYNLLVMGMPTRLTQIAISAYSHNDDAVFVRNKHDSTWSSWRRFYTDAQRIPIANGGTGLNTNPSLLVNLASGSAAGVFAASPRPGVTGTLPVARGGTGVTSLDALKTALGISSSSIDIRLITTWPRAVTVAAGETRTGKENSYSDLDTENGLLTAIFVFGTTNIKIKSGQKVAVEMFFGDDTTPIGRVTTVNSSHTISNREYFSSMALEREVHFSAQNQLPYPDIYLMMNAFGSRRSMICSMMSDDPKFNYKIDNTASSIDAAITMQFRIYGIFLE